MVDIEDVTDCENVLDFSKFLNDESVEDFTSDFWNAESFEIFSNIKNACIKYYDYMVKHKNVLVSYNTRYNFCKNVLYDSKKPFKERYDKFDKNDAREMFKDCEDPEKTAMEYYKILNKKATSNGY